MGGETLLSLQQPRAFYLRLAISEDMQNGLTFKPKGGKWCQRREPRPPGKGNHSKGAPRWDAQGVKGHMQTPFLNPDPLNQWYGIENVARVRVNGESCMALLDNGAQINTITLGFVENYSLDIGPLSHLVGG